MAASVANTAVFMMIGTRLVGIVSTSVNHSRSGAGVLAASYKRRANLCCSSKWQGLRVGAGTLGSLSRRSRPRPLPAAAHVCSTKQAPTPSYRIRDRQAAEHVVTHIIETQIPEPTLQESRVEKNYVITMGGVLVIASLRSEPVEQRRCCRGVCLSKASLSPSADTNTQVLHRQKTRR